MQRELAAVARASSIRLVGPNCLGLIINDPDVRLNATFNEAVPPPGGLAVASQSGGVGIVLVDLARELGLGIHTFVSLGNKADVSSNDLLAAWYDDPTVTAAALYLESFGNARSSPGSPVASPSASRCSRSWAAAPAVASAPAPRTRRRLRRRPWGARAVRAVRGDRLRRCGGPGRHSAAAGRTAPARGAGGSPSSATPAGWACWRRTRPKTWTSTWSSSPRRCAPRSRPSSMAPPAPATRWTPEPAPNHNSSPTILEAVLASDEVDAVVAVLVATGVTDGDHPVPAPRRGARRAPGHPCRPGAAGWAARSRRAAGAHAATARRPPRCARWAGWRGTPSGCGSGARRHPRPIPTRSSRPASGAGGAGACDRGGCMGASCRGRGRLLDRLRAAAGGRGGPRRRTSRRGGRVEWGSRSRSSSPRPTSCTRPSASWCGSAWPAARRRAVVREFEIELRTR